MNYYAVSRQLLLVIAGVALEKNGLFTSGLDR